MSTELILKTVDVYKEYGKGDLKVQALRGINIEIHQRDFRLILGPSGCGKTTLLNILGGLSPATSGEVLIKINGELINVAKISPKKLTEFRRFTVGLVFQFFNLIPILTALENIELSARLAGIIDPNHESIKMLKAVGLENKANRFPSELSGGEQQRIAIARVLVKHPLLILADEPTGNLDRKNAKEIYELFEKVAREYNSAVLIVTHDHTIAEQYGSNHIHIADGKLVEDE